jgi:hypothetical protein
MGTCHLHNNNSINAVMPQLIRETKCMYSNDVFQRAG